MTLFEIETTVGALPNRRSANLPVPTKQRYMPTRAGIINVWEYDDQQFWFADGRLLLRGRNEAGKSKVLELLFPFVLDGDITPKKLDPFDTANKSMFWNMIGFSKDRTSVIGYLWIEFGRLDAEGDAEYQTVLVGVQATRAERRVNTWFAVTPQRVDVDLDLAPGNTCRNQESLTKALSVEARFATKSSSHRANVAARLFAMTPERFDNLLHLLRQLRKPKLADKLDSKKLSSVLTDALPPLDEQRIEPLANGFGFLDADIAELRRNQASLRSTEAFLDVYRGYARSQVRHRAAEATSANNAFDKVTKDQRAAERALADARDESDRLASEAIDLAREHAAASGSLAGLDLSAVESLRSLEQTADADDTVASGVAGEHERLSAAAADARRHADEAAGTAAEDEAVRQEALQAARRAAGKAQIPTAWEDDDGHHDRSAENLAAAVATRRALVEAVDEADRRTSTARELISAATSRLEAAVEHRDEADEAASSAASAADSARDAFASSVADWLADAPNHRPVTDINDVTDELADTLAHGDRATRGIVARLASGAVDSARDAERASSVALSTAEAARAQAQEELDAHNALQGEAGPPRRPGIPLTRAGIPFWQAVDFSEIITPSEAAMLEAALDAAGLLDAVITEVGLVDLTTDDTLIVGVADGAGVSDWLQPAEGDQAAVVGRVLAAIGAGSDSGQQCWVDIDGRWANGPLTGRWSKPNAEHIGAAARMAAHERRREALEAALHSAESLAYEANAEHERARAALIAATDWHDAFPSGTGWANADREARRTGNALAKAERAHDVATRALEDVRKRVDGTLRAVERAVAAASCEPNDVPATRACLDVAAEAARELRGADRDHTRAATESERAQARADRLHGDVADAAGRLETVRLAAMRSRGAYDTAVALQGADVERIIAEKDRLEASLDRLRQRQDEVNAKKSTARDTEVRAEGILDETGRRRAQAIIDRDSAFAILAGVVRTGHVALVVPLDAARDASDYLQATAARNLARQITDAIPEAESTQESRSRSTDRLVVEFNKLRDVVGSDFDPHLDSAEDLFVASATLNGEVIGVAQLHSALAEDVEVRQNTIAANERALIEQHLRDEVGNHLGERLHAATVQVQQMNSILRANKTNSGAYVQLQWKVDEDAGPAVRDALKALLTASATRDEAGSAVLGTFLAERVALARRGDVDGADLAERLIAALDYRTWHSFGLTYKTGSGEADLTAKSVGAGSGGQQAKVAHLPLLAAAAGFYSSSPSAPRLCFLDEAFAGIDGPNTAGLLDVSVKLDLDMVMTNYDAWFCVPQVPGLAIYHLEKLPGTVGVAAIRYEWDGDQQQELDPWLDG